jgi:hypothetical protein
MGNWLRFFTRRSFGAFLFFLGLCVFFVAGCVIETRTSTFRSSFRSGNNSPSLELIVAEVAESAISGTWSAQLAPGSTASRHDWISIQVRDQQGLTRHGSGRPGSDFPLLFATDAEPWPGEFSYATEGGVFLFRGLRSGRTAEGGFTFEPDPGYVRNVSALLQPPPAGMEWLWLALRRISAEEIAAYARSGVRMNVSELLRLQSRNVRPDYLAAVRQHQDFSIDEVIRLRNHGVRETFPAELHQAGYRFGADELIRLRNHGVSAEDAAAWKEAGYDFKADQLTRLRSHGVKPAFGRAVRGILPEATVDDLTRLRNRGVNEQYLAELHEADPTFSTEEVVYLRNRGVPADYVMAWRKAGYDFNAAEIAKLRNHGVPASYAAALAVPDRKPLPADTIARLRQRGLSAEEIRQLRE